MMSLNGPSRTMACSARTLLAVCLAFLVRGAPVVTAATVGPDGFGYVATDNGSPLVDVSTTGAAVGGTGDDYIRSISLPFTFTFYGLPYNTVVVSSNGVVWFGTGSLDFQNRDLVRQPIAPDEPVITALWDDWYVTSGIFVATQGPPGARRFLIQWNRLVPLAYASGADHVTFQVVLFEADSSFEIRFADVDTYAPYTRGASSTVGIRGVTGNTTGAALQWGYNIASVTSGQSIRFTLPPAASAGDLDPAFGTNGVVAAPFAGGVTERLNALAVQTDGKIVAAGYTDVGGTPDFAIARYLPNGALDSGFGVNGLRTLNVSPGFLDMANAVAVDSQNRIVAAGVANIGGSGIPHLALVRLTSMGALDTSFDNDGIVTTSLGAGSESAAWALAMQPNGQPVVGGYTTLGGTSDFLVARYTTNGQLDPSFGTGGYRTHLFRGAGGTVDTIRALVIQGDGKIVAGGYTTLGGTRDFALTRYTPSGDLDLGFGVDGDVTHLFDPGEADEIRALALQPDGRLVAAGLSCSDGSECVAVARYTASGQLDATFDGDGRRKVQIGPGIPSYASGLVVLPDARIVLGVRATAGGTNDFGLVRLQSDGLDDATFAPNGTLVRQAFGAGTSDTPTALVATGGKLVQGGYSNRGGTDDFALMRVLYDNGSSTVIDGIVGGSVASPDGLAKFVALPGAVPGAQPISITSNLSSSDYGAGTTAQNLLTLIELEPDGLMLGAGATVELSWLDANSDGIVDGRGIREDLLRVYRNGVPVPGTTTCGAQACTPAACCDRAANKWTITITGFSEWALGSDPCGPVLSGKLSLRGVRDPPGDDKLTLAANFIVPGDVGATLDPVANGVLVQLIDGEALLLDALIPPGAYDQATRTGWKANGAGTTWTWKGRTGAEAQGIVKATIKDKSARTPGLVEVKIAGRDGAWAAGMNVRASIILPSTGQCLEAAFPETPPARPSCSLSASGTTLTCK